MPGTFHCVEGCNHGPFTLKGLALHRKTCSTWLNELKAPLLSCSGSEAGDVEERAPKRCRLEEVNAPLADNNTSSLSTSAAAASTPAVAMSRPFTHSQAQHLHIGYHRDHDKLPDGPPESSMSSVIPVSNLVHPVKTRVRRQAFRTEPDTFGRYRVYTTKPLVIPDVGSPMAHVLPTSARGRNSWLGDTGNVTRIISPCPNISVFYIMRYHWLMGETKSLADRDYLCSEVLLQPDFNRDDLIGVNLKDIDDKLAAAAHNWDPSFPLSEGWKNIPLRLAVPPPRITQQNRTNPPSPSYVSISGFRALTLLGVMRKAFSNNDQKTFHYEPFEEYHKPPGLSGSPQRLSGEMYTSPAMIHAHQEVQSLAIKETSCKLPRCTAAYMFASDGVQFASFSRIKGWPILCSFGNQSKYERCKPTSNTCYQLAHIPSLPDRVQEEIKAQHGKPPSEAVLTHLRRELMHSVWNALIDEEFIDAWKNGVIIDCADGIRRRVFPRIMTYSADYPEKVLLATIRNGGDCLCPRCLVRKSTTSLFGTPSDMNTRKFKRRKDSSKYQDKILQARRLIYDKGQSVQSKAVEDLLKENSYVPVMNAFSFKLGDLGFNIFSSLVINQLHEVELGVWKALFKHLIRLLHLSGNFAVVEFNRRFRSVPSFSSTIRMFAEDVSELGRIAARDYEDILQCCIPVFEGLLPDSCEGSAQKLLFIFATWHGLSKLRLHTEDTLRVFKSITTQLGDALREFASLTEGLDVRETPKEYAHRRKQIEAGKASAMTRRARSSKQTPVRSANTSSPANSNNFSNDGRRVCKLNLDTYKAHSLPDYPRTIEEYGTTDSYSTQINELQNRKIKGQYARTNHRNVVEQMTRVGDITAVLEDIDAQLKWARAKALDNPPFEANTSALDSLLDGEPYSIGVNERSEDAIRGIPQWVASHQDDDATKLKQHLLARILGSRNHPHFNDAELIHLRFYQERMWRHKTLGINYTSYDVLRQQDPLNPSTSNRFIMLASDPTSSEAQNHPFLYAKILGIYHARVIYKDQRPERMDFVHIRWLYYDFDRPGGWGNQCLDRLGYLTCRTDEDILDSFDFIDPDDIIRACHLIPDFHSGTVSNLLSSTRSLAHDDPDYGDWSRHYVGRFVDRDMLMRYIGGGIGHCKPKPDENTQNQVFEGGNHESDPGYDDEARQVDYEPVHEGQEEFYGDDLGEDGAELEIDTGEDIVDDESSVEDEAEVAEEDWDDLWGF